MKKQFLRNLLLVIFINIFMVAFSAIFSAQNTLIGVGCIIAVLLFRTVDIGIETKQASLLIFVSFALVAVTTVLPFVNLFLTLLINFVVVFLITILSSSRVEVKSYMPALLCYAFAVTDLVKSEDIPLRIITICASGVIASVVYYLNNKNNGVEDTFKSYLLKLNIKSEEMLYTIKISVGLTIGMLIVSVFEIEKGLWVIMTIVSLTTLNKKIMVSRSIYRVLSTIIGGLVFIVLFEFILPTNTHMYVTFLFSYIYTFLKAYFYQIIFVTISVLGIATQVMPSGEAISTRLLYVAVGTLIIYLVHVAYIFICNLYERKTNIT